MRVLKIIVTVLVFTLLTLLTQIGGVVYVVALAAFPAIEKRVGRKWVRVPIKAVTFLLLYAAATFFIVPPLAALSGRVPLPVTQERHLKPLRFFTCLLNRHYVTPELRATAFEAAGHMNERFPGTMICYLDANFPFFNGYPLLPHLSHSDGKKLDLAFCYSECVSGLPKNGAPSWNGYGVCEAPRLGETDMSQQCRQNGNWQYNLLRQITPQGKAKEFVFDASRTAELLRFLCNRSVVQKIFIEPHLKDRLMLHSEKIGFQGCRAVRHDDHIHVQVW